MTWNNCSCKTFVIMSPDDMGKHHHKNCEKYSTEKHRYLFYLHEGIDAFLPFDDNSLNELEDYEDDEVFELHMKFESLTDKEFNELPEAD